MTETTMLLWAFVYAWAGWLWGDAFGWPWLGAIVGFFAGMAAGNVMNAVTPELSLFAPVLAIVAWWLVPRAWLPHAAAAICALPLACFFLFLARNAVRESRARHIVGIAATAEDLVPHLASSEGEVHAAAIARFDRLEPAPDERARAIAQVAARLGPDSGTGHTWLTALLTPLAQAVPLPREALLLLYERLGGTWYGGALPPGSADEWIQRVLFERVKWDDDEPLRRASRSRIEKGWNVDRMVGRLLETDAESGARMAEEAFPAGALSTALLLRVGEGRAAAVIEREIGRAASSKLTNYDRVIEAAIGLAPGLGFPLLERALEWDPAEYCIERSCERWLIREAQPALSERCARAPGEAARFLAAVRSRIARLETYDWSGRFNPGWHPKARLDFWNTLRAALESCIERPAR